MNGRITDNEQERGRQTYVYSPVDPQQSCRPSSISPQPWPQIPLVQTVSPLKISQEDLSQQGSPRPEPQSPLPQETPGYTRSHGSQRGLMSDDPIKDSYSNTFDGRVVDEPIATVTINSAPFFVRIMTGKWSMVGCLTIGVAGAIGHNFLYTHLHGREATNQQWWLRLGQLISFISNASFTLATVMAHQQVAWRVVGQRGFSVHAIDSLFGATHNILELFNREAWAKSWFAMFLALYMWFSPLVVILTSATLYVVPGIENTLCPNIRTLNFSLEAKESFQSPTKAKNEVLLGRSLCGYNWTAEGGNLAEGAESDDDIFEYYNVPSSAINRIAAAVFSNPQAIQKTNVSEDICGEDTDCSFTIEFVGPGYKCEDLANGVGSRMKSFGDAKAPIALDDLVPASNYTYIAITDQGEYMRPQMNNVSVGGVPSKEDGPPFPKNLGVFRTEPSIWIGYTTVKDYAEAHALSKDADGWNGDYTPIIFACDHMETKYKVVFNMTAGFQRYNVVDRKYLRKIIDTTWKNATDDPTDGTADTNIAEPDANYVSPRKDYAKYRRIAAYHTLGLKLREQIFGNVMVRGSIIADGPITTTTLLDRHESLALPNFKEEIRRIYEALIISLLSDPQLLVVAWASDPSKISGPGIAGEETNYPCERRRKQNFFKYNWPVLAAVYAVALIIASVGVYYGIDAMSSDGSYAQRATTFSAIARATENIRMDEVEKKKISIRYVHAEERPGGQTYEFRTQSKG